MTIDANVRGATSTPPTKERRRSERVLIRIPLILYGLTMDNQHVSEEAATSIVNRHGALVRTRALFKPGATLEVTNNFSKDAEKFRVVWISEEQKEGLFELAVEMVNPREDFWGISFPTRPR